MVVREASCSGGTFTTGEDLPAWYLSGRWRQYSVVMHFMGAGFAAAPEHLHVQLPNQPGDVIMRRVEAEADELCSFVRQARR
jgi:hypothetical protein